MMKAFLKITLLLTSTLPVFSQGVSIIQGQVTGFKDRKVYLYSNNFLGGASQVVDSVRLAGQYFSFRRPINEPTGYFLSIDEAFGQFYFIWDKDLFISLNANDLNQSIVEESPINALLKSFSDTVEITYNKHLKELHQAIIQSRQDKDVIKTQKLYQQYFDLARKLNDTTISFIQLHRESWVNLLALLTYHRDLGRKQTLDLLDIMNKTLQKSHLHAQLKDKVSDTNYTIAP